MIVHAYQALCLCVVYWNVFYVSSTLCILLLTNNLLVLRVLVIVELGRKCVMFWSKLCTSLCVSFESILCYCTHQLLNMSSFLFRLLGSMWPVLSPDRHTFGHPWIPRTHGKVLLELCVERRRAIVAGYMHCMLLRLDLLQSVFPFGLSSICMNELVIHSMLFC